MGLRVEGGRRYGAMNSVARGVSEMALGCCLEKVEGSDSSVVMLVIVVVVVITVYGKTNSSSSSSSKK
ncbi:hypothetical protein M0802_007130 [Mischocyttarus mexicanus]|nr:hypothetical protein M0802_007130 [Mischocyttarus mexicanus]